MILIGTIHQDLEGPSRLESLIGRLQPKVLTIEAPANLAIDQLAETLRVRRQLFERLSLSLKAPNFYKELVGETYKITGYDILVPIDYARRQGIEVHAVDHPALAELIEKPVDEKAIVDMHNSYSAQLVKQMRKQHVPVNKLTYAMIRPVIIQQTDRAYYDPHVFDNLSVPYTLQALDQLNRLFNDHQLSEEREQHLTEHILALRSDVHVAGLAHVSEEYKGVLTVEPLYQRLGEQVSQRIRLCDAI